MFIGELARRSQTTIKALRLYESLGLLGPVQRQGKYRVFDAEALQQVQLIRQAQRLGFRLAELQSLIHHHNGRPDWTGIQHHLARKAEAIRHEIERLHALQDELGQLQAELSACLEGAHTPPLPCV
jgi:DNA-binding transcriptional MerR regulator